MVAYNTYSDRELIAFLKEGDHAAFTEIFHRYNQLLYSHTYNKLRDEEESRDIVEDVFMKLWEKQANLEDTNLAGYLFTLARNQILNLISHRKVVSAYTDSLKTYLSQYSESTDHLVRRKQLKEIIDEEINALPPRMREIFLLSRKEYLSNKEIAKKLDLSEHTVADQIKKALRTLRLRVPFKCLLALFWGS